MIALPSRHPLESQRWKAIWQEVQLSTSIRFVFFPVLPFHLGGLRLKTWDHAPSHPWLPLIKLQRGWFCWILVSCALSTLQKHALTESHAISCSISPYTWLKCDGREKWAAGSWGQAGDCDLTCNQTFYQSSLTSEGPSLLENHRSTVGRGWIGSPSTSSSRTGLSLQWPRWPLSQPVHCTEVTVKSSPLWLKLKAPAM